MVASMRTVSLGLLLLTIAACSQQGALSEIDPTLSHAFEPIMVDVAEEVSGTCQSWTLDNDKPIFVSKIRQTNDGAWHHSNWFFVPEGMYPGPDGTWPCDERGFHDVTAGLAGGAFFAQSTQALQELQAFQEGAVLEIPPRYKIVGGVHLVNITAGALETALRFDIETVPEEQVQIRLRPIAFTNTTLDIEPQARSRYGMTCDLEPQFQNVLGRDPDYNIYYVLAHYHEWGNYFRLSFVDDVGAERTIFEFEGSVGQPLGTTLDPAINSQGAGKLRFECGYINNTDQRITYGLAGKEMCVFLAYSDAALKIGATSGVNTPLGPNQDGVFMNETECGPLVAAAAD